MLKKGIEILKKLWTSCENDTIAEVWGFKFDPLNYYFERAATLADRNFDLQRQLAAAKTRASKNGCLALLAFGLIAIEILGVTIYFLPK